MTLMFKRLSIEEKLQKERERNLEALNGQVDLAVIVSEREINEIIQGQQISDLEIQLLEIQLGGIII